MEVLDSHVEALAFNHYLSCSFITIFNHLWAWVALNLFKLRPVNSPSIPHDPNIVHSHPSALLSTPFTPLVHETTTTTVVVSSIICGELTTKGRFTAVYNYEENRETADEYTENWLAVVENEDWDDNDNKKGVCGWEVVRMRMRDDVIGYWYGFQDLKVINGNVVRLWDDFRK